MRIKSILLIIGTMPGLFSCGNGPDGIAEGVSKTSTTSNYSECSQIISAGIFDEYQSSGTDKFKQDIANWFCSMSDTEFYDHYLKSENSSSSSNKSGGTSLGVSYEDFGLDFGHSSGKSAGATASKSEVQTKFNTWKKSHCGSQNKSTDQELVYSISQKNPNSKVVEAWQSCVSKQSKEGLSCWAVADNKSKDQAVIKISYDSGKTLPRTMTIDISHDDEKFTLLANKPTDISVGDGLTLQYRILDLENGGNITVNGNTKNPHYTSSCNVSIPGKLPLIEFKDSVYEQCEAYRLKLLNAGHISFEDYTMAKEHGYAPTKRSKDWPYFDYWPCEDFFQ